MEKETQTTLRMNQQRQQQQTQQRQQIEDNPEPAAKEMYELMKTLPDDAKEQLLNQIFTPTSTGGFVEAGGVKKGMPDKYNPIANVFMEKGWAMFDEKGNVSLSEPEPSYEKVSTFEIVERGGKVYKLNTVSGEEEELGSKDEPGGVVDKINKEANEKALALSKEGDISFEDAKYDALIDNGVDPEVAADLAKVKEIPEGNKKTDLLTTFKNWVTGKKPKAATKEDWEKAAGKISGAGEGVFNEANVTALVPVISDDVTPAERAHLISQGATDADIDEAIKRKAK